VNPVNLGNATEAARAAKHGEHLPGPSSVRRSGTIGKLAVALAKAQAELKNPPKDSVNPHFKSRYADLATVRDTVLPVLARNGLSVLQLPCEMDGNPALTTVLMHGESGEFWESTILLRPGKMDPQGIGSALTYHRRYSLQALAGVAADDDDDGNAASAPVRTQAAPKDVSNYAPKDNMPMRARHAQALAQAANTAEVDKVAGDIAFDVKNGTLSELDVTSLRAALADARKRVK
jgi:hypothetical protein